MAEVMLHRTQAIQVVPVYERFISHYPDLQSLALAPGEELNEMLYPLGLHWRINLIQDMVAELMNRFDGKIPYEKVDLMSLPGVSDYIASAVRCFAWNQPTLDLLAVWKKSIEAKDNAQWLSHRTERRSDSRRADWPDGRVDVCRGKVCLWGLHDFRF